IEPDSVVRFIAMPQGSNDLPHVYLAAGQLTAAMPDRVPAQPLVVGTGVADVFAKAGIFVVASTGPESARVDVRKGKVEVVRPGSRVRFPMDDGAAYFQAGLAKVITENSLRVDSTPSRTLQLPGQHDVVFAPDGEDVWIGSSRQFTLWTRDGGTANKLFAARKGFDRAFFARDRRTLVTLNIREGQVLVRDVPDGIARATFDLKLPEPRLWTVSRGAEWFAMTDPRPNHRRLHVIDGRTGKERYLREFEKAVGGMTASPDGKILAVGLSEGGRGLNNQVLLLDAVSGERLAALPTQRKGLMSLIFSDDGSRLAVGFNGLVQVWNVKERELLRSITGFERVPTCLAFSPDSRVLAAGTQDGQVWLWSLATGQPIQRLEVAARGVRSMCFGKDGKRLVTMAVNSPVAIWDVAVPPAATSEVQ
ncbi:MAG TPA: hypothetical protein VLM40_02095, partial [Gemmata sp.]|nr:hypothetical protein [Gemmata sp.]